MTLLLREVAQFLLDGVLWIGIELLIAAGAALTIGLTAASSTRRLANGAFIGAVTAAAASVRFGLPLVFAPEIGGRALPVVWSLTGAAVGASVVRSRTPALTP